MDYDLGYVDLEERTLQLWTTRSAQSVTYVSGPDPQEFWSGRWESNPRLQRAKLLIHWGIGIGSGGPKRSRMA